MGFVLTRPTSSGGGTGGSPIDGMTVTIINGQPVLTLEDTTRGNKILSVAENPIMFSENVLYHNDWIRIASAVDRASGYVVDFDGTIVSATGHCKKVNSNDKNIHLFTQGVDRGSIFTFSGSGEDYEINTLLNIDFNRGDKIRLSAKSIMAGSPPAIVAGSPKTAGRIQDTVIKLVLKWRGS